MLTFISLQRTLKEKMSHLTKKFWVTGGTKIRPEIPSNWRIFEWNWLDIESHFDLQYRVIFTLNIDESFDKKWVICHLSHLSVMSHLSKWVIWQKNFESLAELKFDLRFQVIGEYLSEIDSTLRVILTYNIESFLLSILSHLAILTLNVESFRLKYSPITRNPGSNFISPSDFRSKWLHFFQWSRYLSTICNGILF